MVNSFRHLASSFGRWTLKWNVARWIAIGVWLIVAAAPHVARAINFTIEYTDEGDPTPHPENPSWDPDGAILKAHFQAAKEIWEFLLPGPGEYEFDFHWDDDIGTNTLGLTTDAGPFDLFIEINPNFSWFADPTPRDSSEFMLPGNQRLFSGLTPAQQATFFPGSPPPAALETAYSRSGIAGSAGPGGFDAATGFDLLTVILHEMGHVLGIAGTEPGEYNISPGHVGGLQEVLVLEGDGHLAGNSTMPGFLMCGSCAMPGARYFPTATDVLVIAEDQGISIVRLQRVGRISDGLWGESNQWIGGAVPDFVQDVYISHGGAVTLDANARTKDLLVAGGNSLFVQEHWLDITGTLSFDGALVSVNAGGIIAANGIVRGANELVTMAGSQVRFNDFQGGSSTANFNGNVAIGFGPSTDPAVTFDPTAISSWTIAEEFAIGDQARTARLIIDGGADFTSGTGRVGSNFFGGGQGAVTIDGAGSTWTVAREFDAPNGVLNVINNGRLEVGNATLGSGTGQTFATIDQGTLRVKGILTVGTPTQTGDVLGKLTIQNSGLTRVDGDVNVSGTSSKFSEIIVRSNGLLAVDGDVVVGPYGLVAYGDATSSTSGIFRADTFINLGGLTNGVAGGITRFFDDASAGTSHFTNHPGSATFAGGGQTEFRNFANAGSARFDNLPGRVSSQSGATRFFDDASAGDGEFFNHPGFLNIHATVEFNGDSTGGQGTFTNLAGVPGESVGGAIVFNDRSRAGSGLYTSAGEGGIVIFNDQSNADRGTFSTANNIGGNSRIQFFGNASAGRADFYIRSNTFLQFHDDSTAARANVFLAPSIGTFPNGGGSLTVFGGTLADAVITAAGGENFGYPGGHIGLQNMEATAGSASITLLGGSTMGAIGASLRFDFDSSAGAAHIVANGGTNAGGGSLVSFARGAKGDDSNITIHAGAALDVSGNRLSGGTSIGALRGEGTIILGGSHLTIGGLGQDTAIAGVITDGAFAPHGQLTKIGGGTLALDGQNSYTGLTTVEAGTLLVTGSIPGDTLVKSGATLGGTGIIGGAVSILPGGIFAPGISPGEIIVGGDLRLDAASALEIEIGGVIPGTQFDVVTVHGDTTIDGQILLKFIDGFAPRQGDTFPFLFFGGDSDLANSQYVAQNLLPGFQFDVVSSPTGAVLTALSDGVFAYVGDTNGDGAINIDDLNNVRNHFGTRGPDDGTLPGDAFPFNGRVDIDDLNAVRNYFGGRGAAIPEPSSFYLQSLVLMVLLVKFSSRRRRDATGISQRTRVREPQATARMLKSASQWHHGKRQ